MLYALLGVRHGAGALRGELCVNLLELFEVLQSCGSLLRCAVLNLLQKVAQSALIELDLALSFPKVIQDGMNASNNATCVVKHLSLLHVVVVCHLEVSLGPILVFF